MRTKRNAFYFLNHYIKLYLITVNTMSFLNLYYKKDLIKEKKSKSPITFKKTNLLDFAGGAVVKNPPCNAEDVGCIPSLRSLTRSHMLQSNQAHVQQLPSPHALELGAATSLVMQLRSCVP